MALSNSLSKIFNSLFPFADFMYILQQEEYSSRRLVRWLPRFFLRRNFQIRDHVKFTQRVKVTLAVAVGLWLISFMVIALLTQSLAVALLLLPLWLILIPLFVLKANILTRPVYERIKLKLRGQAAELIRQQQELKGVAVAGSYGKTTTKNFIYQMCQYSYKTQMIPGNINTPAGIAGWILKNFQPGTQLLIVEMDAYEIGEIARSCEVLPADIAVLTNVGDQHLERFGTKLNLAKALSEVFTYAKPNAHLICNSQTAEEISAELGERTLETVDLAATLSYQEQAVVAENLSQSNLVNLRYALRVCELLNIPAKFVLDSISKLELPDRRQRLTEMYGYQAVDDSYNISFTTAQAGLAAARKAADAAGRKLLVITGGIPELSPADKDKNHMLGVKAAEVADHIVILGTMFGDEIAAGVGDHSRSTRVPDLKQFLASANRMFPPQAWFLLMQPELGDLYY